MSCQLLWLQSLFFGFYLTTITALKLSPPLRLWNLLPKHVFLFSFNFLPPAQNLKNLISASRRCGLKATTCVSSALRQRGQQLTTYLSQLPQMGKHSVSYSHKKAIDDAGIAIAMSHSKGRKGSSRQQLQLQLHINVLRRLESVFGVPSLLGNPIPALRRPSPAKTLHVAIGLHSCALITKTQHVLPWPGPSLACTGILASWRTGLLSVWRSGVWLPVGSWLFGFLVARVVKCCSVLRRSNSSNMQRDSCPTPRGTLPLAEKKETLIITQCKICI